MEVKEEGRLVVKGRAEIDTRAPFNSVKEAVMLFGERVLATGIYAVKLREMGEEEEASKSRENESKMGEMTMELEGTKMELEKAREEAELMGKHMLSLKEELEQTKRQLQWLKAKELMFIQKPQSTIENPETEDLKFIENSTDAKMNKIQTTNNTNNDDDDEEEEEEDGIGKKRNVKFASPPSLTKVISTKEEKSSTKRNSIVPIIRCLISKKKGTRKPHSPTTLSSS